MQSCLSLPLLLLLVCGHAAVQGASLKVFGLKARGLRGNLLIKPDPYVFVEWGRFYDQTEVISNTRNPDWTKSIEFFNVQSNSLLLLEVWDQDLNNDDLMGSCTTSVEVGTHVRICDLTKGTLTYSYTYTI